MRRFKNKNSRRRGIAIELAISLLLIMTAMSSIILTTTMIQVKKQAQSVNDLSTLIDEIEKTEYDQIGTYFKRLINGELTNINNETELPITLEETQDYKNKKKEELEKKLNGYFNQYKIKKLSFGVTVEMNIVEHEATSTETLTENKLIIKTIQNFSYTIKYKLIVEKGPEETKTAVFETQHQISFSREATTIEEKETKDQDVFNTIYYTFVDESGTILLEINQDYYITFGYPEDVEFKDVSVVNSEDNNNYIFILNEGIDILFKLNENEESKEVGLLLIYKLNTEEQIKEITINVTIKKEHV